MEDSSEMLAPETIKIALKDGSFIRAEVASFGDNEDVGLAGVSFEGVGKSLKAIAEEIGEVLADIKPSRASVEFGLEIGMESGQLISVLVKGTGSATLKVTLDWDSRSQK